MIIDLLDTSGQDRYIADVIGYNFSVLMADPLSKTKVRRPSLRGLGADYCRSNPPDATTQALLAARGQSVNLIDCGYSTGSPGTTAYHTATAADVAAENPNYSAPAGEAPVYQPPAGIEDCAALGLATGAGQACVTRNTARSIAAENTFLQNNENYETQLCVSQGGEGWVPAGQDVGQWCAAQYQGAVPAGYTPTRAAAPSSGTPQVQPAQDQATASAITGRPNQSVPPNTPITHIPSMPSPAPTVQTLFSAYGSGAAGSSASASAQVISGIDNKTLAIAGAALVGLFLVMKGK